MGCVAQNQVAPPKEESIEEYYEEEEEVHSPVADTAKSTQEPQKQNFVLSPTRTSDQLRNIPPPSPNFAQRLKPMPSHPTKPILSDAQALIPQNNKFQRPAISSIQSTQPQALKLNQDSSAQHPLLQDNLRSQAAKEEVQPQQNIHRLADVEAGKMHIAFDAEQLQIIAPPVQINKNETEDSEIPPANTTQSISLAELPRQLEQPRNKEEELKEEPLVQQIPVQSTSDSLAETAQQPSSAQKEQSPTEPLHKQADAEQSPPPLGPEETGIQIVRTNSEVAHIAEITSIIHTATDTVSETEQTTLMQRENHAAPMLSAGHELAPGEDTVNAVQEPISLETSVELKTLTRVASGAIGVPCERFPSMGQEDSIGADTKGTAVESVPLEQTIGNPLEIEQNAQDHLEQVHIQPQPPAAQPDPQDHKANKVRQIRKRKAVPVLEELQETVMAPPIEEDHAHAARRRRVKKPLEGVSLGQVVPQVQPLPKPQPEQVQPQQSSPIQRLRGPTAQERLDAIINNLGNLDDFQI